MRSVIKKKTSTPRLDGGVLLLLRLLHAVFGFCLACCIGACDSTSYFEGR